MPFLQLLRPHQYIKNAFVFAPLFFVGQINNDQLLIQAFLAFLAFCAVASAIYILNDYQDIEEDQKHPVKKFRPLAAGKVSKSSALALMLVTAAVGLGLGALISMPVFAVLAAYLVLNVFYCFWLKHVALIDISIIAVGFVLRLFAGAVATAVSLSAWIVIMTFLLALFLALAKRRDDILIYQRTGEKMRKVVDGYNLQLLDFSISIMASVIIVSYIVYTTAVGQQALGDSSWLYLTTIFVVLGILRYLQLTLVMQSTGSPTKVVMQDRFTQCVIVSWIIVFSLAIYL